MSKKALYKHKRSGDLFAIETDEAGKALSTSGPLLTKNLNPEALDYDNYWDPDIEANINGFELLSKAEYRELLKRTGFVIQESQRSIFDEMNRVKERNNKKRNFTGQQPPQTVGQYNGGFMGHNIEIKNGEASMFYVNEEPWHGLGQKLEKPATAQEAIQAAKLDWRVMKVPLYAQRDVIQLRAKGKYGVVREDLWGNDECSVLGIVGRHYTPLQNSDSFTFFDPIVGENAAIYHTAGVLGAGERIWILAKLPDDIRVVGDDIVNKYLLLSNSHDGTSAVQVKFTPIRVVCQNTLTMALSRGQTVRVAHTKSLPERLQMAVKLLGIIKTRFNEIETAFKNMTRVTINENRLAEYYQEVFPDPSDPENDRVMKRVQDDRLLAEYFFDQGKGNRIAGVAGTLWAAYNGVTELVDHRMTQTSDLQRLKSVWFGGGYFVKARAFRVAEGKLSSWVN